MRRSGSPNCRRRSSSRMSVTGLLRPAMRVTSGNEWVASSDARGLVIREGTPVTSRRVAQHGRPGVAQHGRPWVALLARPRWLTMGRPLTPRTHAGRRRAARGSPPRPSRPGKSECGSRWFGRARRLGPAALVGERDRTPLGHSPQREHTPCPRPRPASARNDVTLPSPLGRGTLDACPPRNTPCSQLEASPCRSLGTPAAWLAEPPWVRGYPHAQHRLRTGQSWQCHPTRGGKTPASTAPRTSAASR
jgi:hypothetical protein